MAMTWMTSGLFQTCGKNKEIIPTPRISIVIVTSRGLHYFRLDEADRCRTSRLLSESGFL